MYIVVYGQGANKNVMILLSHHCWKPTDLLRTRLGVINLFSTGARYTRYVGAFVSTRCINLFYVEYVPRLHAVRICRLFVDQQPEKIIK